MTLRMASSLATSHATSMVSPIGAANGLGATRVQRMTLSAVGSPDATPSENGVSPDAWPDDAASIRSTVWQPVAAAADAKMNCRREITRQELTVLRTEFILLGN